MDPFDIKKYCDTIHKLVWKDEAQGYWSQSNILISQKIIFQTGSLLASTNVDIHLLFIYLECFVLKKLFAVTVLGGCVVTSSFAFNLLHVVGANHHKKMTSPALNSNISNKHYTDFSGKWMGDCITSGDSEITTETVVINNTDSYISMDDDELKIGGFHDESDSDNNSSSNVHIMANWSAGGAVLSIDGMVINRSNSPISTDVASFKSEFTLQNGQLITKGSYIQNDEVINTIECRFSRI